MTALKGKGKAAVKLGMQYGKLVTDSRFCKPPKWKRKTGFSAIASAVRESAVCLYRSFATWRWVDEFLDATNLQIDRGVTRLDGAWGKKQVWRPHFLTWGLPETNVVYWRMYVWHCWAFWRPRNHSAPPQYFSTPRVIWPRVIETPLPHRCAPVDWTIIQRVKSYKCLHQQTTCRYVTKMHWTCLISSKNYDPRNYGIVQLLTSYTWTT